MRVLLDTQAWLWMIADEGRLTDDNRATLHDPETDLYLSAAAVWEITIKAAAGRLKYIGSPSVQIPFHIRRSGVVPLSVTVAHSIAAVDLPMHHRDPFDRIMVAQARTEELTLATTDARLSAYDVPLLVFGAQGE